MIPIAKKDGLTIERKSDGFLIQDPAAGTKYRLNLLRSMIWKNCDGKKSPYEIRDAVCSQFGPYIDEETIWSELIKLFSLGLLLDDPDDSFSRYARM